MHQGELGVQMVRRLACALIGAAALFTGCATPYVGEITEQAKTQVYLLRGLWDVFSIGLDSLASELEGDQIAALSMTGPDWATVVADIEKIHEKASNAPALVLIGHSYGADDAIRMAKLLEPRGINVALLVLIDPTRPDPIPANVDRCIQYYVPTGIGRVAPEVFAGTPAVPEAGNERTVISNYIVSVEVMGPGVAGVDHFNIESSGYLHSLIKAEVDALSIAAPPGESPNEQNSAGE